MLNFLFNIVVLLVAVNRTWQNKMKTEKKSINNVCVCVCACVRACVCVRACARACVCENPYMCICEINLIAQECYKLLIIGIICHRHYISSTPMYFAAICIMLYYEASPSFPVGSEVILNM